MVALPTESNPHSKTPLVCIWPVATPWSRQQGSTPSISLCVSWHPGHARGLLAVASLEGWTWPLALATAGPTQAIPRLRESCLCWPEWLITQSIRPSLNPSHHQSIPFRIYLRRPLRSIPSTRGPRRASDRRYVSVEDADVTPIRRPARPETPRRKSTFKTRRIKRFHKVVLCWASVWDLVPPPPRRGQCHVIPDPGIVSWQQPRPNWPVSWPHRQWTQVNWSDSHNTFY